MTIFPKRVWTKKGMVFNDKKPVRQLGDKVGVYDPNFTEVDSGKVYPEKAWENVPDSEELLIYDGEQPTEIGTFEDGTYSYANWNDGMQLEEEIRDQLPEGIDVMNIDGAKKVRTAGKTSTDIGWLGGGEGFGDGEVFVAVLSNANVDVLGIAVKTEQELGGYEALQTLRNAFEMPDTAMTDAIWNQVMGWFSTTLTVTTSGGETTISDGSKSIIIDTTSHAMKYGADGLWTNDTSTEYNTIQTNGWLVDGTYEYSSLNQDWVDASASIENKSKIIYTVTVSTDGGYTTISDGTESILYNTSTQGLLYNADYYAEEPNATALSDITSEGWLVDGTYGYASTSNKKSDWDSIIALLKVSCVQNATITHDAVNGEITIANGNYSMTIMDKNLGASVVYEDGDNLSESNCGKFYQWGNNYGFDWAGEVTKTTGAVVDTTGFGPGHYYSGSTFRCVKTNYGDRSNNRNDNLWGNTTNTDQARQGPAPSGYHIPSMGEWTNLGNFFKIIRPNAHTGDDFRIAFLIPFAGFRSHETSTASSQNSIGFYHSSSKGLIEQRQARKRTFDSSNVGMGDSPRSSGFSIRCFKDSTPPL